jgi:hypothetical protein
MRLKPRAWLTSGANVVAMRLRSVGPANAQPSTFPRRCGINQFDVRFAGSARTIIGGNKSIGMSESPATI